MEKANEPPENEKGQEDWDEDEEEYDDEGDEDIDKEAQEIARRLGEQLWADISKVNAERSAAAAAASQTTTSGPDTSLAASVVGNQTRRKEEAIVSTMRSILMLVEKDSQAKTMMLSATVPNGPNVLELLYQCTASGTIEKGIAGPLSQMIVSLAKSEALFGTLRQSNAPAIQLDIGKRKREAFDDGHSNPLHPCKRPYIPDSDLHHQVVEAVRIIAQTLGTSPSQPLDPSLVSSIRLQLHQVFLFAVTSASVAGPNMHALQEIGGLIQVIGVLSGIQIGHTDANVPGSSDYSGRQTTSMATDIGTAVYPCLISGCGTTFPRLYSLRAHQRSHASHRPHRCSYCPASFARNHDLKRHIKLHDRKAWKCQGCHKIFSRRDAIKRHKNGIKNRGATSDVCLTAEVVEVQLEGAEAEAAVREERRAKLWNEIAVNEASGATAASGHKQYRVVDDGAINPAVILSIQTSVLSLHGLLQTLVGNALGNPLGQAMPMESLTGQATLASVIARVQSQNASEIPTVLSPQPSPSQLPTMIERADAPTTGDNSSEPQTDESLHRPLPPLSMYGLSDEQTRLLEIAIANASSAAQAQAEAEAALEEEQEGDENDYDEDNDDSEMEQDKPEENQPIPAVE